MGAEVVSGLRWTQDDLDAYQKRTADATQRPVRADWLFAGMEIATEPEKRASGPEITLRLAWPPSVNAIWRNVAGRTLLSAKGRQYYDVVSQSVGVQRAGRHISGRAAVAIDLHAPTRRAIDIDNRVKVLFDSIVKGGLLDDDSQIDVLVVRRAEVVKGGSAVVRVAEIFE